jgi:alanine racemase
MSMDYQSPLRLRLDRQALVSNYSWLREQSGGAACGAAIKANGYGLGAEGVMQHLAAEGCRDFFVATWEEAQHIEPLLGEGVSLSVFHGVRPEDMEIARASRARPVLNSAAQIARWKEAGGGPCDVMIDTGMNRLGLSLDGLDMGLFDGLEIDTLMSHLVSAEDDHHLNDIQLMLFREMAGKVKAMRYSLANSAGICRGADFAFDLTRPGIALYGGTPTLDCELNIQAVVTPQAEILQRRTVRGGESVGYGADFIADRTMETATINIGYADGFARIFSGSGAALKDGARLPVIGRVSMDLVTIDVNECPSLQEGDWVDIDYDLGYTALVSGLSHQRSMHMATPMPPPMHSVARPFFASRRPISNSSVFRMRAPEAPIGWPMAMAPPFTLTIRRSQPMSLLTARPARQRPRSPRPDPDRRPSSRPFPAPCGWPGSGPSP